jgi:DNA polymerase-3 subunit delta
MKLAYPQLAQQLAKKLAPIYLVCGDEPFLKYDAIQQIRKAAKKAGADEKARIVPEAAGDWEPLYAFLYTTSLFACKRLLELDMRHAVPNKDAGLIIQKYAEKPPPDNILLIATGKIDDKTAKSGWYQALEKAAIVVTLWPLSREQLPGWITQRMEKYKLHITPDALVLLADSVEGNLAAAAQAIEKVYLLQPQGPVDTALLADIQNDAGRFTVFDFVDSLLAGDQSRALHLLDNLKAEGAEPAIIVWGIAREFRLLAEMAQGLRHGLTYERLFQKHRVFPRRGALVKRFLGSHSLADCMRHLKAAAEIDGMIKGAVRAGDLWESLQWFCLRSNAPK